MTIRTLMDTSNGDLSRQVRYIKTKDGPIEISVDTGEATIHKVMSNGTMVVDAVETVTASTPKIILGPGVWEVVRNSAAVTVEATVLEQ